MCPQLKMAMQPRRGSGMVSPHLSQGLTSAECTPSTLARARHQLTKQAHQSVSSGSLLAYGRVVLIRYSMMRGLLAAPGISRMPSSPSAIDIHGHSSGLRGQASSPRLVRYCTAHQPLSPRAVSTCFHLPSGDVSEASTTSCGPSVYRARELVRADSRTVRALIVVRYFPVAGGSRIGGSSLARYLAGHQPTNPLLFWTFFQTAPETTR